VVNPPVYAPFYHWVAETRTRLLEAPLHREGSGRWTLDLEALEEAFRQGPAAYILCNPHNPVGRVHAPEELASVVSLAHEYGVRVISDEIHAPLVLPGGTFTPLLTVPGAEDVAVSLASASKAWNLAGLKCALVVSAPPLRSVIERLPPDGRWRIGHFGALATVAAFTAGGAWLDALLETLDLRRRQLGQLLAEHLPSVRWHPPEATYLAWLDCRSVGTGRHPHRLFLERGRVALDPGPVFGRPGSGYVRLNFATSGEILAEAVRRMGAAVAG
jgi:cystathionine beta-lyase